MIRLPKSFGGHGATVVLYRRGKTLYLRWWVGDRWHRESLKHGNTELGLEQARIKASERLAQREAERSPHKTVGEVVQLYQVQVSTRKPATQASEDKRRAALWVAVYGDLPVETLSSADLSAFVHQRRNGLIVVPNHALKPEIREGTIGADIIFLQSALNWAVQAGHLIRNPIRGFARPRTAHPRRPVSTYDRFLALMKVAGRVHPRFPAYLTLIESVGWRLSAIARLRFPEDVDRQRTKQAPYGRLRLSARQDKEHVELWVPLTKEARKAIDGLKTLSGPLFPAVRDPSQSWDRYYCRTLLERAEKLAGLTPLDGSDFHAFRRKWATERKGLPDVDVAAAGGWRDPRTLKLVYQQVDAEGLLAVVMEPKKLREAK